jgi:ribosomal protein S14
MWLAAPEFVMPEGGADTTAIRCSFCDRPRSQVAKMVRARCQPPHVYICNECAELPPIPDPDARCSLCGRGAPAVRQVSRPVQDSPHGICNECADLCREMWREAESQGRTEGGD